MWITATAVVCLLLPLFGLVSYPVVALCCALIAAALVGQGVKLFSAKGNDAFSLVPFFTMQITLSVVMALLSIDKLLHTMTSF